MSVPAETPAEVTYLPASTHRDTRTQCTLGPWLATQPNALWLVAAGSPSRKPQVASHAAPVKREAMIFTRPSMSRIHLSRAATPSGSASLSSSGHVPPPPGTIRRSSGSLSACAQSQSGGPEGPLMLLTLDLVRPFRNVSNGSGGG